MKIIFTIIGILFLGVNVFAQNVLNTTYSSGDIATSFSLVANVFDESCNAASATVSVKLPAGDNYTVTGVDVNYTMTSLNGGYISDQFSKIKCQTSNVEEANEFTFPIVAAGTQAYNRTNISIANGSYIGGTELVFQMKARRFWESATYLGCNSNVVKVNNGSWQISVHYSNVITNPKVGVQTATPTQTLDVNGKLKLGNDNTAPLEGTIRWNSTTKDFEGFNGSDWISFTKNEGSGWGTKDIAEVGSKVSSDGTSSDSFGGSVSISGDYAVVGAALKSNVSISYFGKAYIFKKTGISWAEEAILTPSDPPSNNDFFGSSVSISGDYVIVGASGKQVGANFAQGKAYVFKRTGTSWIQQAALLASDGAAGDRFGSVSISGDYAIVGASYKNTNQGKAYIFKRTGTTWLQQTSLLGIDVIANDFFGGRVSISGDYAIIGAENKTVGANTSQGKVYVFKRTGTSWAQQAALVASFGVANDRFGIAVAISNDYAVVGAFNNNVGFINSTKGKAYIFNRTGNVWTQQTELIPSEEAQITDFFGGSVSIDGENVIVGAYGKNTASNLDQGKAYVFKRIGNSWVQQAILVSSDGTQGSNFGSGVSISDNNIIVGAYLQNVGTNINQGKIYFFKK